MNWDVASKFATVIGELSSAGALVSLFLIYRMGRRDDYVAELKRTLATLRGRFHRLNQLMNYELLGDLVRSVVFAPELERPLRRVYDRFFVATPSEPASALSEFMKSSFPPITVPIRAPLVESYESLMIEIDSDLAKYQTDFPALYRVCFAVRGQLSVVERAMKRMVTDDDLWQRLIPSMREKEEISALDDLNAFRDRLALILQVFCQELLEQQGQKNIDHALSLFDLVVDAYLALPEGHVVRWAKSERRITMVPTRDTKRYTDDLREAEKALKNLLRQDEVLRFRELVTRLDAGAA